MARRIIDNADDLSDLLALLPTLSIPFTIEWRKGRDRSIDQNNLQWLWAAEASRQRGDMTTEEVQAEWKLRYGVPILREESEMFRGVYDQCIKHHSYEDKIKAMGFIDVTSIMTVRQMVRFLDTVQRECLQQGIRLTDPDPMLKKYQQRYRRKAA